MGTLAGSLALHVMAGACAVIGLIIIVSAVNRLRSNLQLSLAHAVQWLRFGMEALWGVMGCAVAAAFETTGDAHDWAVSVIAAGFLLLPFVWLGLVHVKRNSAN